MMSRVLKHSAFKKMGNKIVCVVISSDMFDPVVSPFKVSMDVVMAFIKNGFESGSESLQRQTLTWLQVYM